MEENKQNDAYKYLFATIQMADWIPAEYREMAEKYRTDNAALKELFLCFCDNVPLDVLQVAEMAQPADEAFRRCRKKHLESDFLKKYADEIQRIRVITAATEHEVRKVSGTVKHIADAIPTFDELFAGNGPEEQPKQWKQHTDEGSRESPQGQNPKPEKKEEVIERKQRHKENWLEGIVTKLQKILKHEPANVVVTMLSRNYTHEQINFVLNCIDEGMTEEEIKAFADPRIPVDVMQKLKEMKLKERKQDGK